MSNDGRIALAAAESSEEEIIEAAFAPGALRIVHQPIVESCGCFMSVNASPETVLDPAFAEQLERVEVARVVLEVTAAIANC